VGLSDDATLAGMPPGHILFADADAGAIANRRGRTHRGAERRRDHDTRYCHSMGPVQLALAGAVRAGILRHRDDEHGRVALLAGALRC
jgi:hypothetical protein